MAEWIAFEMNASTQTHAMVRIFRGILFV
ncbi:MAG: hypothetical protein JWO82_1257, partial [Akkermansiaceae bacterium]|nr:hypothetical protein [Akkermansiaceae bacterium]